MFAALNAILSSWFCCIIPIKPVSGNLTLPDPKAAAGLNFANLLNILQVHREFRYLQQCWLFPRSDTEGTKRALKAPWPRSGGPSARPARNPRLGRAPRLETVTSRTRWREGRADAGRALLRLLLLDR